MLTIQRHTQFKTHIQIICLNMIPFHIKYVIYMTPVRYQGIEIQFFRFFHFTKLQYIIKRLIKYFRSPRNEFCMMMYISHSFWSPSQKHYFWSLTGIIFDFILMFIGSLTGSGLLSITSRNEFGLERNRLHLCYRLAPHLLI